MLLLRKNPAVAAGDRYAVVVAPRTEEQHSEEAHRTVYAAMEKAMRARGLRTARALAQALNANGYAVSERAVAAWRSRESAIPAWALVAFSKVSGLSPNDLMAPETSEPIAQTIAGYERALADLQERVEVLDAQHRRELSEIGRLLARMTRRLEEEGIFLAETPQDEAEGDADAI